MASSRRRNRRAHTNPPATVAPAGRGLPQVGLSDRQTSHLLSPIDRQRVLANENSDPYLQGWDVQRWLTRHFGMTRWGTHITECVLAREIEYPADPAAETPARWQVAYRATVELTIRDQNWHVLTVLSGVGAHASDRVTLDRLAEAHVDTAKAAETDALKRAARHLGDQYGLSLRNPVDPYGPVVVGTLVDGRTALPPADGPAELVVAARPGRHRQVSPDTQALLEAAGEAGPDQTALRRIVARAKRAQLLGEHAGRDPDGQPATLGQVLDQLLVRAVHAQDLTRPAVPVLAAATPVGEMTAGQGEYLCCGRSASSYLQAGMPHPADCADRPTVLNGARA